MVIVNVLANVIPINGVTTGQVSDSYPNLFAPAGYAFAIWGLIYFLLAGYTLYQLGFFQSTRYSLKPSLLGKVGILFAISSIANAAWIFAWHNYAILVSMILMIIILVSLIMIVPEINRYELARKERFFVQLPFSVYFGWITVATIANATTLLVSWGWNGFGISEVVWTVVIIVVGLIISMATMIKNSDIAYGLVIIWAYVAILVKHLSPSGFADQYPAIIATVIISLVLLLVGEGYILFSNRRRLL
jgi:hypothetical protein